jgi:hypothetical protein
MSGGLGSPAERARRFIELIDTGGPKTGSRRRYELLKRAISSRQWIRRAPVRSRNNGNGAAVPEDTLVALDYWSSGARLTRKKPDAKGRERDHSTFVD